MLPDPSKPDPGSDTRFARLTAKANEARQPGSSVVPPSRPLQLFLLFALLLTGVAYVVGEWTNYSRSQVQLKQESKLKRLVRSQNDYFNETKLGNAAEEKKQYDQAASHYRLALQAKDTAEGHYHLSMALLEQDKTAEAESQLKQAVLKNPGSSVAQFQLGAVETKLGKYEPAIEHYEAALVARPDDPATLNGLAILYATATNYDVRSPKMAVLLATRACAATTNQNGYYVDTLARAYAAEGDFLNAIGTEQTAIRDAAQLRDMEALADFNLRYGRMLQHKTP